MERWRVILGTLLIATLAWWLYPQTDGDRHDGTVELTVWFNGVTFGRHHDVIDAFERRFPQYHVILGSSAVRTGLEGEGNPQRLMCGIAGGVPPEIVEYDRFAICQWASRNAFLDLNPLIKADRKRLEAANADLETRSPHSTAQQQGNTAKHQTLQSSHGANPSRSTSPAKVRLDPIDELKTQIQRMEQYNIRSSDYYEKPWRECQYRQPGSDKVGQYGIPNYMDDRVLYYNTDMLMQAGCVDAQGVAKPPESWEQVLTKRVDVTDAAITGHVIQSGAADFLAAGVRSGDTLCLISKGGLVTRTLVDVIQASHRLTVRSPYSHRTLVLPEHGGQHIKIFSADSYCLKLSRWDESGNLRVVGFAPQHGNAWLYLYGWANGGRFMSDDKRTCTLDDPRIVQALQWTTDIYDALGGADRVVAFRKSFQNDAQDPFILGQIAMFIHGDWFMRDLVRFKRNMRFGTCPAPIPQRRLDEGHPHVTWVAGFAYCIPSTCPKEKLEAAWTLLKFLASPEAGMIMNEHDAQRERAQGRLYIARMKANRRLNALQKQRYMDVPEMPLRIRDAMNTHIRMLDEAFFRPVTPIGQVLWNAQADAQDIAWSHTMSPGKALKTQAHRVQRAIESFYSRPAHARPVYWRWLVAAYGLLLILIAGWVSVRFRLRRRRLGLPLHQWRAGVTFALPWLLGFVVLSGGPMVFSAIMSFTRYDVINDATFVGLDNYREMFTVDWGGADVDGKETVPTGVRHALLNTLFMAIGLPIGMVIGLLLAMLLDTRVSGLKFYRTLFFLPTIMPIVAASILWIWVFNAQGGLLNWAMHSVGLDRLIEWLNIHVDWINLSLPISWLTNKTTSKPALIIMGLWGAGASMIIWLAGLKDIPTHLYEAAVIDGAGPIRRFFRITLPMLSPYILFNLIIGMIQTFQIFTQAYIMTPNGYPERSTYFYVYKLFDECFSYFRLGYGAAMAWVLFLILVVLTLINMKLSQKWVFYAGEEA